MPLGDDLSPPGTGGVKEPFPKGKGETVLFVVFSLMTQPREQLAPEFTLTG